MIYTPWSTNRNWIEALSWRNWTITAKFAVTTTVIIVLTVTGLTLISAARERAAFAQELRQQATLTLETVEDVAADALYTLDVDDLKELVNQLETSALLSRGLIYDDTGRVIADSANDASLIFSFDPDPLGLQLIESDETFFEDTADYLRVGQPIILGRETVGAVSLEFTKEPLNAKIAEVSQQSILAGTLAILIGGLLTFFTSRSVTNALRDLTDSARKITAGQLDQTLQVDQGAELRVLAGALNAMTNRLRDMIENLETRVKERTLDLEGANEKLQAEIVERERAQQELAKAHQQTLAALELKTQILANVSHDARTPLSVIRGYAEMVADGVMGDVNADQADTLNRIVRHVEELEDFISKLLDSAQIEGNRLVLVNKRFRLADVLESVESALTQQAGKKGVAFTLDVDPDMPDELYQDQTRLQQIFMNLGTNAIKFTDTGSASLHIKRCDETTWQAQVIDTGIGIDASNQSKIFDLFWQVDGTDTRRQNRGVGLGLSIVRQLVHLMGGELSVESEINKGSTFTVTLPFVIEKEVIS